MTRVQKAVFPGMLLGCLALVLFASLVASPHAALASNPLPVVTLAPTEVIEGVAEDDDVAEQPPQDAAVQAAALEQAAEQPAVEEPLAPEAAAEAEVAEEPGCSISAGYPQSIQQWCEIIDRYASENQVNPNLIAAVMLQESGGNPQAYSKSGAVGLLQVMPRDGKASGFMCINGPCFASRPSSQELYDPEFNIAYGTGMLAGLIQRHGDVRDALRAYGPMNVGYYYADIVLGIFNRY